MTMTDPDVVAFYESPNEVRMDSLQGELGELVRLLVARLTGSERTVLPAKVDGTTRWYGLAPSDREDRLLREELSAWLGPPLSRRAEQVDRSGDELDQRALSLARRPVLRVDVTPGWQGEARANIRALVDLWTVSPEREPTKLRPVGRVLRQFYEALASRDRGGAIDALEEIRSGALLSAANVRFLRVEMLGTLGTADELRSEPSLADITLLRRPPAVSDHLARAADALYVPHDAAELGPEDWRSIATEIEDVWPGLVTHPSQVRSVYGARCLGLTELLAGEVRAGVVEHLESRWSEDGFVARLVAELHRTQALAAPKAEQQETGRVAPVLAYYQRGEYELTLDAAEKAEVDRGLAAVVMHAALNLGDSGSAARAIAVVDRLSQADREVLLGQAVERAFHDQLVNRNEGSRIPTGWADWLTGAWPDRPDLLASWSLSWSLGQTTSGDHGDKIAAGLLDALHDERRGRVRNGLPVLVRSLVTDEGIAPSLIPLAVMIVDIMLGSEPGRADRRAALELLDEVFLVGCAAAEYQTAVAAAADQLERLGPREVDWLAQVLDVFLSSAAPDPQAREQLLADALGLAVSWSGRVDAAEARVLQKVFADAGLHFQQPSMADSEARDQAPSRTFSSVGIYSLSESAAQNAARWIADEWPGVDVRLSHAHTNSAELQSLAQGVDVLLMQTSHAKHAATLAIERAVDEPRLVRVNGRGTSSLYRALLAWVASDG